jgi:hypothetical protein
MVIFNVIAIFAQAPFGGFSTMQAYKDNTPDILDSSFVISEILQSVDKNDKDFRLEYKDERGKIKLYRKKIIIFGDGENYFIADGEHNFGAPRFRKLTRCDGFSYFRRVYCAPPGTQGHSEKGVNEAWIIIDNFDGTVSNLTDKTLKQILIRTEPLLYDEYSDKSRKNGSPIDYIKRICN